MSAPDDARLVAMCLAGDVGAFGALIDRHQKTLFNTALRMAGDYEDARDITQNTFVKAYEKLDSFRPEYKFFSWIYRILVNEGINTLKLRRAPSELDVESVSGGRRSDDECYEHELSSQIDRALFELSFEHRIIVVLRYFNDMSYEELSEILSLPLKTVKSRLHTARQNLASILQRMGVSSW